MYIYHALINALSAHIIHINLNMIFYTHIDFPFKILVLFIWLVNCLPFVKVYPLIKSQARWMHK